MSNAPTIIEQFFENSSSLSKDLMKNLKNIKEKEEEYKSRNHFYFKK